MKVMNSVKLKAPFKGLGSKRLLVKKILPLIPEISKNGYYIEPFCGCGIVGLNVKHNRIIFNDTSRIPNVFFNLHPGEHLSFLNDYKKYYDENGMDKLFKKLKEKFELPFYDFSIFATYFLLAKMSFGGKVIGYKPYYADIPSKRLMNNFDKVIRKNYGNGKKISKFINSIDSFEMFQKDYKKVMDMATYEDFVFIDPPYSKFKNKTKVLNYGKVFNQKKLADECKKLTERGVKGLQTNFLTQEIKDLYKGCYFIKLGEKKNTIDKSRNTLVEYAITNYDVGGDK